MFTQIKEKIRNMFSSDDGKTLFDSIMLAVNKHGMLEKIQKGVLLGFSGGADSVMLLCFLVYLSELNGEKYNISCLHVNHLIRGEEADRDAEFSRAFSSSLGVGYYERRIDVPRFANEHSLGLEEAARNVRYSCFEEILQGRDDISCVALAHNSTDNVETVLLNMLRGTGVVGLCGIPAVRDCYVRPLLLVSKREITYALDRNDIPYVTDSTNLDSEYKRNYIRNEVLPVLRGVSQDIEAAVSRMTSNVSKVNSYVTDEADKVFRRIEDIRRFNVSILRSVHEGLFAALFTRIVRSVCGESPNESQINEVYSAINKDAFSVSVCGGYDFVCQRGVCFFRARNEKLNFNQVKLSRGINYINGTNVTVVIGEGFDNSSSIVYKYSIKAQIKDDIIDKGLYLRLKNDGDSYKYGGMTHKLKKVFNDRGIPSFMRERIPVICDNEGIVWVVGLPVRDGAKDSGNNNTSLTVYFSDSGSVMELFTACPLSDR